MDAPPNSTPSHALSSRIPALEGLRGLAAIIVLIDHLVACFASHFPERLHAFAAQYPGPVGKIIIGSVEWIYDGHYAVWVFWVMSAIVLSLRYFLLRAQMQPQKAQRYLYGAAIRRYPRLVIPILASVLIAWMLHVAGLMRATQAAAYLQCDGLTGRYTFAPDFLFAIKESFFTAFVLSARYDAYIQPVALDDARRTDRLDICLRTAGDAWALKIAVRFLFPLNDRLSGHSL